MRFLSLPKEQLTELFVQNLLKTNRGFNFYVNWECAEAFKQFEVELNAMDVLIGAADFDSTFVKLLRKLPSVVATFPLLFALSKQEREAVWRGTKSLLVANSTLGQEDNLEFEFAVKKLRRGLSDDQIALYRTFFERMGLKHLVTNLSKKSIVDYCIGVLVGMDSNGRKNRGGQAFELACAPLVERTSRQHGLTLLNSEKFESLRDFGFRVSEDVANRRADFILVRGDRALNIEVNYFDSSGSKPEETVNSYINQQRDLEQLGISFAYITDGQCWGENTKPQLQKAFRHLRYFMNFNLAKQGMLDETIRAVFGLS